MPRKASSESSSEKPRRARKPAAKKAAGSGSQPPKRPRATPARKRVPALVAAMPSPAAVQPPSPPAASAPRAPSPSPAPPARGRHAGGPLEERFIIPTGYGDHRIVLMVKDPWWIYAYWEVQPGAERQVRSQLAPDELAGLQSVLRVYDVTDRDFPNEAAHHSFDIPLSGLAMSWFIHTNAPDRAFVVDLGLLTNRGRFLTIIRSNRVATPRFGPSDVIDEQWMVADEEYWRLLGVTTGIAIGMGSSPSGLRALLERTLHSATLSSPGLFSPTKPQQGSSRDFWLRVDTELIVYGATDPKASVSIQGQPVQVKPDGTFSVRMALPDGTVTVPVDAVSPDRQEKRHVAPTVTRTTTGRADDPQPTSAPEQSGIA